MYWFDCTAVLIMCRIQWHATQLWHPFIAPFHTVALVFPHKCVFYLADNFLGGPNYSACFICFPGLATYDDGSSWKIGFWHDMTGSHLATLWLLRGKCYDIVMKRFIVQTSIILRIVMTISNVPSRFSHSAFSFGLFPSGHTDCTLNIEQNKNCMANRDVFMMVAIC